MRRETHQSHIGDRSCVDPQPFTRTYNVLEIKLNSNLQAQVGSLCTRASQCPVHSSGLLMCVHVSRSVRVHICSVREMYYTCTQLWSNSSMSLYMQSTYLILVHMNVQRYGS